MSFSFVICNSSAINDDDDDDVRDQPRIFKLQIKGNQNVHQPLILRDRISIRLTSLMSEGVNPIISV